jgi:hypothetical protein
MGADGESVVRNWLAWILCPTFYGWQGVEMLLNPDM